MWFFVNHVSYYGTSTKEAGDIVFLCSSLSGQIYTPMWKAFDGAEKCEQDVKSEVTVGVCVRRLSWFWKDEAYCTSECSMEEVVCFSHTLYIYILFFSLDSISPPIFFLSLLLPHFSRLISTIFVSLLAVQYPALSSQ